MCFFLAFRNWYARVLLSVLVQFRCIDLGMEGIGINISYLQGKILDYFYQANPNIQCWSNEHLVIFLGITFPSFIFWSFILPGWLIYFIKVNKRILKKKDEYHTMLSERRKKSVAKKDKINTYSKIEIIFFFFTGLYKDPLYYFYVVELAITFILLFITQVSGFFEDTIQRMIIFICFSFLFLFFQKLEPFENPIYNKMVAYSISICLICIILEMIGSNPNNSDGLKSFASWLIFLLNLFFYIGCLTVISRTFKEEFKELKQKICFWRKKKKSNKVHVEND